MNREGIGLLDAGLAAFGTGEHVRYLPGFVGNRCYTMDHIEGDNSVKLKNVSNVIFVPEPVIFFRHTNKCTIFCLYKDNTRTEGNPRMVKEVSL